VGQNNHRGDALQVPQAWSESSEYHEPALTLVTHFTQVKFQLFGSNCIDELRNFVAIGVLGLVTEHFYYVPNHYVHYLNQ
jgi:hypothetical protein